MLGDKDVAAMIAVSNLDTARKFHEDTLGLKRIGSEGDDLVTYRSGHSTINVYRSPYAGTNQATALTWVVGKDVESIVSKLKAENVTFEHYQMPQLKRDGDVHARGDMKIAWFKDPDGNILSIVSG